MNVSVSALPGIAQEVFLGRCAVVVHVALHNSWVGSLICEENEHALGIGKSVSENRVLVRMDGRLSPYGH